MTSHLKSWGTLTGAIPSNVKYQALQGDRSLNNRPLDIVHNHEVRPARILRRGYSETAPDYHLYQCLQKSDPPQRKVKLVEFKASRFSPESKAGQGGCSMRNCPGQAVQMNKEGKRAFCERCLQRVTGNVPCKWTSITLCRNRHQLNEGPYGKPCSICREEEK